MNSIKEFFDGFRLWDFIVIFFVSDFAQAAIVTAMMGTVTWFSFISLAMAVVLWNLHIHVVRFEIKNRLR